MMLSGVMMRMDKLNSQVPHFQVIVYKQKNIDLKI